MVSLDTRRVRTVTMMADGVNGQGLDVGSVGKAGVGMRPALRISVMEWQKLKRTR